MKKYRKVLSVFFDIKLFPCDYYGSKIDLKKIAYEANVYRKINKNENYSVDLIFLFKGIPNRVSLNNLSKPILKCLSEIFYKNDNQVFKLNIEKKYNQIIEGVSIDIKLL